MKRRITLKEVKKITADTNKLSYNFYPTVNMASYVSYFVINYMPFINANHITILWGLTGLLGIFLISLGTYTSFLIGLLIYHIGIMIDSVDGPVSRTRKDNKLNGLWLDTIFHYIHRCLLLLAIGIAVFRMSGNIFYLYLGIFISFLILFDNLNKLKVYEAYVHHNKIHLLEKSRKVFAEEGDYYMTFKGTTFKQKIKGYSKELLRPNHPFTLSTWCLVFNIPKFYLILMSFVFLYVFIKDLKINFKRLGKISFKAS